VGLESVRQLLNGLASGTYSGMHVQAWVHISPPGFGQLDGGPLGGSHSSVGPTIPSRRTRPRICIHIRRYSSRPPLDCIWRYTRARTRSARTPPWVPLRHCRIQTHKMGSREVLTVPHILFPWRTNRIDIAFTLAPGINSVNTLGKNVTLC